MPAHKTRCSLKNTNPNLDSLSKTAYSDKNFPWWCPPKPTLKKNVFNRDRARLPSTPRYMFCTGNRYGEIHVYFLRGKITSKDGKARRATVSRTFGLENEDSSKFTINKMDESIEWDGVTDKEPDNEPSTKRQKKAHSKSLYSLIFSQDGTKLYSGAYDRLIKIWDTASLTCLQTLVGHTHVVCALALHGDFLCSGSYDKSIKLWHLETGTEVRTITGPVTQEDEHAKGLADERRRE